MKLKAIIYFFISTLILWACEEIIEPSMPSFSEIVVSDLGPNKVNISSSIIDLGNQIIEDHGFIVSKDSTFKMPFEGNISKKMGEIGRQTPVPIEMKTLFDNLTPNTEYFVFPFVTINEQIITGSSKKFKTPNIIQPGIKTVAAENVSYYTAKISGSVLSAGTFDTSEYGLVWSENENPTTSDPGKYTLKTKITNYPTNFATDLKELKPNTTYYYRAYVISNAVLTYGEKLSFKTSEVFQPKIVTGSAEAVTVRTAKLGGTISQAGSFAISERGVVWSTSANPTVQNSKASLSGNVTQFPSNFTVNATELKENTTYHYRAYVISDGVISYGEDKTFKTPDIIQPTVTTGQATNVGPLSATLAGSIGNKGTFPISERGVVWSTAANPTASNSKASINGDVTGFPNNFTVNAQNLSANTTYHYRAYVISDGVISYGEDKTFKTPDIIQPTVTTGQATNVGPLSATLAGTIGNKGTYPISERGVVWSTGANPTTSSSKASINGDVTGFPNNFTVNAQNLSANTTYHYRAYVISNGVTSYGEDKTFKTTNIKQPSVRTDAASNVGSNSARLNGTVTDKGTHDISEYGIVFGTSANPTTSNNKQVNYGNVSSVPKSFGFDISGLNPATTYYFRAYVIMEGTVTYGGNQSFTTTVQNPVVTTGDLYKITGRGYVFSGTVQNPGSYGITEMGIVYNTSNNPTTSNNKLSKGGSGVSYPHEFNFTVSSLSGSTIYYRAYAISNGVTYYGDTKTYTNTYPPGLTTGSNSYAASSDQVTISGTVNSDGSPKIKEYGIVWDINANPPTVSNQKSGVSVSGSINTPLNFSRTFSGSVFGNCKVIKYRTYAITNDNAVHYSSEVKTFNSPTCIK